MKNACEVNSEGGKAGEIVTNALKGELGTVAKAEAASGVGLYLKAEAAPKDGQWWKFGGSCFLPGTAVYGTTAAEVVTLGKQQVTNQFVLGSKIRNMTLTSGEKVYTELEGYLAGLATLEGTDEVTFGQATGVS